MEITPAVSSLPQTFQSVQDDTLKSSTTDKVVRLVIAMGLLTAVGIGIVYMSPLFPITTTIAAVFLGFAAIGLIKQIAEQLLGSSRHRRPPKLPMGTLDIKMPSQSSQPKRKFHEPEVKDLDSNNGKLDSETTNSPTASDLIDRSPPPITRISRNSLLDPLKSLSWYSPFDRLFRYGAMPSIVPAGIPGNIRSEDMNSTDYSPLQITDKIHSEHTSDKFPTPDSTYTPLRLTDKKWDDLNGKPTVTDSNQPLRLKDLDEKPRIEIID